MNLANMKIGQEAIAQDEDVFRGFQVVHTKLQPLIKELDKAKVKDFHIWGDKTREEDLQEVINLLRVAESKLRTWIE